MNFPQKQCQNFKNPSVNDDTCNSQTLDSLPSELIIKISSYLDTEDLESLSMTCKQILTSISECKKLIYKLPLKFTKNFHLPDWIDIKKFQKVKVFDGGIENYLKMHRKLIESITSLSIECNESNYCDFKSFLWNCENLRHVKLDVGNLMAYEIIRSIYRDSMMMDSYSIYFNKNLSRNLEVELEKFILCGNILYSEIYNEHPLKYFSFYSNEVINEGCKILIKRKAFDAETDEHFYIEEERHCDIRVY